MEGVVVSHTGESESVLGQYTPLIAASLIGLQLIDALLTGIGVSRFGIESEGNPMLRELMVNLGAIPALTIVKMLAICAIVIMASLVRRVRWVPHALLGTCCIYLAFAVIPWSYYLFFYPSVESLLVSFID